MGKTYKGKTCAYCGIPGSSTEGDHVVARGFFPPDKREGLPIVPACAGCNNEKAQLEHYLTAVMPFGGQHADSGRTLELVKPKLEKNRRLLSQIAASLQPSLRAVDGGPFQMEGSIQIDGSKLIALYELIVKGLIVHHWGVAVSPAGCVVAAGFLRSPGNQLLEILLAAKTSNRAQCSLGDGAFEYEGIQDPRLHDLTVWRMSMYGAELSGGRRSAGYRVQVAYGITAPSSAPAACAIASALKGAK